MNVRRGSAADTTTLAAQLGAVREHDARGAAVGGDHVVDLGVELDLGAERLRGPAEHLREAAVAALVERPRAEVPSCSPMLWNSSTRPEPCDIGPTLRADDARRREPALDDVGLEVVVEEVGGAAGQQADEVVQHVGLDAAQVLGEVGELGESVGRRGRTGSAAPCRTAA